MSRDLTFRDLSQGFLEVVRAQAFGTILKICYKFFLVYLGIESPIAKITATRRFVAKGPTSWLDNLSSNSKGEKKSKRVIKKYFL